VTEMITNVDLIEEQIRVAQGHKLRYKQVTPHCPSPLHCPTPFTAPLPFSAPLPPLPSSFPVPLPCRAYLPAFSVIQRQGNKLYYRQVTPSLLRGVLFSCLRPPLPGILPLFLQEDIVVRGQCD